MKLLIIMLFISSFGLSQEVKPNETRAIDKLHLTTQVQVTVDNVLEPRLNFVLSYDVSQNFKISVIQPVMKDELPRLNINFKIF